MPTVTFPDQQHCRCRQLVLIDNLAKDRRLSGRSGRLRTKTVCTYKLSLILELTELNVE